MSATKQDESIDQVVGRDKACQILKAAFEKAPIRKAFGMNIRFDEEYRAIFDLPYNPTFNHGLGGIHGGVFAMLLDNAGWFTAAVHYGTWLGTVEFTTRLLEPVTGEDLQAIGHLVRAGKKLAVCNMEIRAAGGRLVAVGSGTFAVTSKSLDLLL